MAMAMGINTQIPIASLMKRLVVSFIYCAFLLLQYAPLVMEITLLYKIDQLCHRLLHGMGLDSRMRFKITLWVVTS